MSNNLSKFIHPVIVKFAILGALDRFVLIYAVYIMFFAKIGISPFLIGIILSVYEVGKICGEPIFGVIADKFGRKNVIIIGFFMKAIGISSWILNPSVYTAFFGCALIGISKASITGIIEAYMYDEFTSYSITDKFKDAVAIKSVVTNISASIGGLSAGILYQLNGFNGVFITSVTMIVCISIPYVYIFMSDAKIYTKENTNKTPITIIKNSIAYLKSDSTLFIYTIIVALFYSAYIVYTDTNKIIMNQIGMTPDFIAKVYSIAHIVPVITTIIFIYFKPILGISVVAVLATMIWIGIGFLSHMFYGKALVGSILIYLFMFPVFDTCIKDSFHNKIKHSNIRSTLVSFSCLISSFINIVSHSSIGFIAAKYSYSVSVFIFSISISLIGLVLLSKIKNI